MEREALEQCRRWQRIVTEGWMLPPWHDIPAVETFADCRLPSKWVRLSGSATPVEEVEISTGKPA